MLRVKNIRNALKVADDSFVNLSKEAQPGDFITVRIVSIEPSKRKDNDGESWGLNWRVVKWWRLL